MGKIGLTRRGLLSLAPAALVAPTCAAPAGDPVPALYAADRLSGLALRGFDAVTYALASGPAAGRPGLELTWSGLIWRFAGPANRAAFARDPARYAPRLGGYDPEGIAAGRVVDADPLVAAWRDGLLYLFRSPERRERADAALLAAAEARWPALRAEVAL
ncbi:hypothetical protein OPKNFCMD_2291 [Methylobacterium crusticola]|uniref:YHS domain protein n=1 Tax=Methylobacterium crusticola TaxID=1697972 RepID=A0ABQ4QWF6_9HYPH|nr:hypothetical protein [Methylobacterium crusticola]GJD49559.1 hypothetical protein OPKNFCMD_2291 [Methylobacterium crusticola]